MSIYKELADNILSKEHLKESFLLGIRLVVDQYNLSDFEIESLKETVLSVLDNKFEEIVSRSIGIYEDVYSEEEAECIVKMNTDFPELHKKYIIVAEEVNGIYNDLMQSEIVEKLKETIDNRSSKPSKSPGLKNK